MSLIDRDLGYKKFMDNMDRTINGATVVVGIVGSSGLETDEGGFSVVDIASVNEFGSEDGHTPERSWLRSTVDRRRNRIYGFLYKMMGLYVDGKITLGDSLGRVGELVKNNLIQTITDLRTPPNEVSTINAKGSSNPLIDTGRMKGAVNYEVRLK